MAGWTKAEVGGHTWIDGGHRSSTPTTNIRIGWERELKLHDMKGDYLLELSNGTNKPHYFGQWVARLYYHWREVLPHKNDPFDQFYNWLEIELNRNPRDAAFEQILQSTARGKLPEFLTGVQYLTKEADRNAYLVRDQGELLFRRGDLLETFHDSTNWAGQTFAIWVRAPNGSFYTHSHLIAEFHHSSFLAGGAVLGAGEWRVHDGILYELTGKSGHYQTGMESLWDSAVALSEMNVFHPEGIVRLNQRMAPRSGVVDYKITLVYLADFVANPWQQWAERFAVDKNSTEKPWATTNALDNEPASYTADTIAAVNGLESEPASNGGYGQLKHQPTGYD